MPWNGIRAVVFDIGGVIVLSPYEVMGGIEEANGLAPGSLPRGPFAADPEYEKVASGAMSEPEYYDRLFASLRAHGVDPAALRDQAWDDARMWRADVVALLDRLAGRVRLGLLTNDAAHYQGDGWRDRWPLAARFDAIVDAAVEGIRKPDHRIYERCAAALDLPTDACVFVDDMVPNVRAAEAAGMHGFHFDITAPGESVEGLARLVDGGVGRGGNLGTA